MSTVGGNNDTVGTIEDAHNSTTNPSLDDAEWAARPYRFPPSATSTPDTCRHEFAHLVEQTVAFANSLEPWSMKTNKVGRAWQLAKIQRLHLPLRCLSFLPPYTQESSRRSSLFRFATFFEDMALRIGQVLRGGKGKYELLEQLKGSSVFKARVVSNSSTQGEWYGVSAPMCSKD